jgi:hypothetical protein
MRGNAKSSLQARQRLQVFEQGHCHVGKSSTACLTPRKARAGDDHELPFSRREEKADQLNAMVVVYPIHHQMLGNELGYLVQATCLAKGGREVPCSRDYIIGSELH